MNRVSRITVVFLLLFGVFTVANANAFQDGDTGQEIAQIQSRLSALGYKVGADGDYGPATMEAVKLFQQDRGLEADGIVGEATYRALMGRDIPVSRAGSVTTVRRVLQTAMRYVGVPYSFGGTTPDGFDCSGYVRYVFAKSGIYLPRMADEQYDEGRAVSISRLQPGDAVFFSTYTSGVSHVGIYLGDGQFIHASSSRGVVIDLLLDGYWGQRYVGARRFL